VADTASLMAGETLDRLSKWEAGDLGLDGLTTDTVTVQIESTWNTHGRACLRQSDPLPVTVLAATREVTDGS